MNGGTNENYTKIAEFRFVLFVVYFNFIHAFFVCVCDKNQTINN